MEISAGRKAEGDQARMSPKTPGFFLGHARCGTAGMAKKKPSRRRDSATQFCTDDFQSILV